MKFFVAKKSDAQLLNPGKFHDYRIDDPYGHTNLEDAKKAATDGAIILRADVSVFPVRMFTPGKSVKFPGGQRILTVEIVNA